MKDGGVRRASLVGLATVLMISACGGDAVLGVSDAWARPAVGPNGAVYLTIEGGEGDMTLQDASASTEIASRVELHQTVVRDDGTMGMTRVDGVEIPAGATVMMVPGGLHVMLIDLGEPLELGDSFALTLEFDDGSEVPTTVKVRDE